MISLDATTLASYLAASTADARAQAVIDSLSGTVYVRVYNGAGTLMGEGTMAGPWATRSGSAITVGEVSSFTVLQSGTPNAANWYLRFETAGGRWVRGPFGAGGNFTWSLGSTWNAGQSGSLGTVTLNAKGTIQLVGAAIASAVGSAGLTVSGSGGYAHGDAVTITGTGFGTKAVAKPFLWAPFDSSISPSSLGRKTSWDLIESMAYAAGEGLTGGALKSQVAGNNALGRGGAIWTAGVWTTGYGFAWNDYGQKMYLFRREKRNFDIDNSLNWKMIRLWCAGRTYPNWYIATSNGSWNCEGIADINSYPYGSYGDQIDPAFPNAQIIAARQGNGSWRTDEFIVQANSGPSAADGLLEHYVLPKYSTYGLAARIPFTDYTGHTFKIKDGTTNGSSSMVECFPAHGLLDEGVTFPSTHTMWYDDIYLDNTWARVMLGDSATYSSCTFIAPQPPTAWGDTSVTVSLNLAGFPSGSTRYLHVIDDTNTVRQTMNIGVHP